MAVSLVEENRHAVKFKSRKEIRNTSLFSLSIALHNLRANGKYQAKSTKSSPAY